MTEERAYQQEAAGWLTRRRTGCVVAPAGSGKTIIGAMAVEKVLLSRPREAKVRIGVLCNTREQAEQWQAAFDRFPAVATHAVVEIRCAAGQPDWEGYDALLVDECHHLKTAPTWQQSFRSCPGARWGFTATPWGEDEAEDKVLRSFFDNEFHYVEREEVGSKMTGALVVMHPETDEDIQPEIESAIKAEVWRRQRWWKGSEGELWGHVAWQECSRRGIIGNANRNEAAVRMAGSHPGESVLLLVGQIEHGGSLAERIEGAVLCHSKLTPKRRRAAIEGFRSGEIPCLVATSLADEGFDAPIASVLVMVSGGRNEARTIQRAGRVTRIHPGKTHATIHDWLDEWHPLAAKHSRRRVETYEGLGHRISLDGHF